MPSRSSLETPWGQVPNSVRFPSLYLPAVTIFCCGVAGKSLRFKVSGKFCVLGMDQAPRARADEATDPRFRGAPPVTLNGPILRASPGASVLDMSECLGASSEFFRSSAATGRELARSWFPTKKFVAGDIPGAQR